MWCRKCQRDHGGRTNWWHVFHSNPETRKWVFERAQPSFYCGLCRTRTAFVDGLTSFEKLKMEKVVSDS